MKPLTKKKSVSSKSYSNHVLLPKTPVKNRSGRPGSRPRTPPKSRQSITRASIRGMAASDQTSDQSSTFETQHGLDQLAFVAAILVLIAAAIGLYIAWKTLFLPSSTGTVVTF
ncbi:hypothetical protein ACX12E_31180 [Paenibacillus vandeheii]|uniref:Uncharacterized protein n=1 Tax=Paenibacillus vandeheii TaxID=3035917 RepID=A0ABT8J4I0_9BACL|nr:hypothetical protein [Paenibacillus vandeheii]MDN4599989.1 hypothetical protein [Paenibacillus vandeheii]